MKPLLRFELLWVFRRNCSYMRCEYRILLSCSQSKICFVMVGLN